ncbi:MAG: hypothetical protein LBF93_08620 [Zoogloeaceae bacterium]|nr:hypothetical protein [Zoogloeaceae bacterium]
MDWTEVPGESVDACDAALSFFSPTSWRFYLPAYLCRSLFHFSAPDFETDMLDAVIFQLTLPDDPVIRAYLLPRYRLLDAAQRQAVTHFLEFVEQESLMLIESTNSYWGAYDNAKAALRSYWQPDAPAPRSR